MRVLQLHTSFQLPDDFSGGLADAIRLMADYHEEKNNVIQPRNDVDQNEISLKELDVRNLKILDEKSDVRFVGFQFVGYQDEFGKWVSLERTSQRK